MMTNDLHYKNEIANVLCGQNDKFTNTTNVPQFVTCKDCLSKIPLEILPDVVHYKDESTVLCGTDGMIRCTDIESDVTCVECIKILTDNKHLNVVPHSSSEQPVNNVLFKISSCSDRKILMAILGDNGYKVRTIVGKGQYVTDKDDYFIEVETK